VIPAGTGIDPDLARVDPRSSTGGRVPRPELRSELFRDEPEVARRFASDYQRARRRWARQKARTRPVASPDSA
jgi:hypothetical protein